MDNRFRLVQQQTQKLILSPQIRQYLKLLQLPLMSLQQAVEAEMTENPLLEEKSQSVGDEPLGNSNGEAPKREPSAEELRLGESFEKLSQMDENFHENFNYHDTSRRDPHDLQKRRNFQETLITKPEVLSDFLLWQIRYIDFPPLEKKIAEEIIGNIGEDGYLKATVEEIAASCKTDPGAVMKILTQIQELDPPGIGARNLQEALILQLKNKGPKAAAALEIVTNHLDLLKKRDWGQIAKALKIDPEEAKNAASIIARLEPRPGRTFYAEEPIAVTPDAVVIYEEDDDGKSRFKIDIPEEMIPELRINPYYRRLLKDKDTDEKTKIFLREKIQAALNFLKALKLRKSTIREITEEILKAQPEFLEKGFAHLRPLRLKDIASNLGIHESTVSRALNGKYISTPQGTIPYKSFFSTKLENLAGEDESQKSIMEKIRNLTAAENPKKPLSDQEIVRILKADGTVIARRTVAKYRDLLKILPSHLRRKR